MKRGIDLKEMEVTADLDRAIPGVRDLDPDGLQPDIGWEFRGFRGYDDFSGDHKGQRIGLCTVTSFVPSGNVASTWTSSTISGTPSITSSRRRMVVPKLIRSL